MDIHAHVLVFI